MPSGDEEPSSGATPPPWLDAPELDTDAEPPSLADHPAPARRPGFESMTRAHLGELAAPASAVAAAGRLQPTALGERWATLVSALVDAGRIGALTRELAWQAECLAMPDPGRSDPPGVWRLRVEREMLRAAGHVERLQAALAEWLQHAVRLEVEPGPTHDTPALRAQAERERRQRAAEAQIADDPLVRSLLAEFKTARIVPGSVRPC